MWPVLLAEGAGKLAPPGVDGLARTGIDEVEGDTRKEAGGEAEGGEGSAAEC